MLETIRDYAREKLVMRDEQVADAGPRTATTIFVDGQGGEPRIAGSRAGGMDAPRRSRARQPARGHRAGARRRRRSDHRRQDRGRADGLLDPARLLDRGSQVRRSRARAARGAGVGLHPRACALRRCRRSRTARATTPRRSGCSSAASRSAGATASRSTSPRRCRRCRVVRLQHRRCRRRARGRRPKPSRSFASSAIASTRASD